MKKLSPGTTKMSDCSMPMIFIGYEEGSKCNRVYDPAAKRVQVTRDIIFEDCRPWTWSTSAEHTKAKMPTTFIVVYTTDCGVRELDSGANMMLSPHRNEATPSTSTLEVSSPWQTR